MKMILRLIINLLIVSFGFGQYAPRGFRPQGRQFALPTQSTFNQGAASSNVQPQNQYGAPQSQYGAPQSQYAAPQSQYEAPQFQYGATQSRYEVPQSKYAAPQSQYEAPQSQYGATQSRYEVPQSKFAAPQSQYEAPQSRYEAPQSKYAAPQSKYDAPQTEYRQPQNIGTQSQLHPQQQYLPSKEENNNQQNYFGVSSSNVNRPDNQNDQGFLGQSNNQEGQSQTSYGVNSNLGSDRTYLTPNGNNYEQPRQLYQSPNNERLVNGQRKNEDFGIASQNYSPQTKTERRKYAEPTTARPDNEEEESDAENPNVAISTAVARGQYYLYQPDGNLQRVIYKTTQTQEELNNNAYSAKLVYQPVEPITAPIYTYSEPLIRLT